MKIVKVERFATTTRKSPNFSFFGVAAICPKIRSEILSDVAPRGFTVITTGGARFLRISRPNYSCSSKWSTQFLAIFENLWYGNAYFRSKSCGFGGPKFRDFTTNLVAKPDFQNSANLIPPTFLSPTSDHFPRERPRFTDDIGPDRAQHFFRQFQTISHVRGPIYGRYRARSRPNISFADFRSFPT